MKCSVCGERFKPQKKDVYQVTESLSLGQVLSSVPKTHDAIDCPGCGCQHLLKVRIPLVKKSVGVDADD